MKLIRLLWQQSPALLILASVLGFASGLLTLGLISTIARPLGTASLPALSWGTFAVLAAASVTTQFLSALLAQQLSTWAGTDMGLQLMRWAAAAPLARLESCGSAKLTAAFAEDVGKIARALPTTVMVVRHYLFAASCLVYLAALSPAALVGAAAVIGIWVGLFHLAHRSGMRAAIALGGTAETVLGIYQDCVAGSKELRLSSSRRAALEQLFTRALRAQQAGLVRMFAWFTCAGNSISLCFFIVIGVLMYSRAGLHVDSAILGAYTVTMLFLLGPLHGIATASEQLGPAQVSFRNLRQLLDTPVLDNSVEGRVHGTPRAPEVNGRLRLTLKNLQHTYQTGDAGRFQLGPVDGVFEGGQIVFVAGGNGSGKTTFLKLLTGLYQPDSGEIELNGRIIGDEDRAWYRAHFAAVFTEPRLFESLRGSEHDPLVIHVQEWVSELRLAHVLRTEVSVLAQVGSLSSGERKRAALLLAQLEDKPVYVFDEFAADQDPECKELFYGELVPALAARGKLVIVVTHDDRFFNRADCLMLLERGRRPTYRWREAARSATVSSTDEPVARPACS